MDWLRFLDVVIEKAVFFAVLVTALAVWRQKQRVTRSVFADWRYYLLAIVAVSMPGKPILGWVWCGAIYQSRLSRRRSRSRREAFHEVLPTNRVDSFAAQIPLLTLQLLIRMFSSVCPNG
jgi:hypothetical protein